ncbi:hypothetical protein KBC04_05480 [Candidatus Babeliales bacterium]|nr:hypothetical protein [Candidatus Babeliales bacterium]MBP9844259.1 hypothetical protein [Candidatus Babeliales bacterium]
MKKLIIILLSVLCLINLSSFLTAKNPAYQAFTLTNHTKEPLKITIASSYPDAATGKMVIDQGNFSLQPEAQIVFTYRYNKIVAKNKINYQGGLDSMTITTPTKTMTYTTRKNSNGLQYFPCSKSPQFSYNNVGFYESGKSFYINYDTINLTMRS